MKKAVTDVTEVTRVTDKTDVTVKSKPIFRSAFATKAKVVFESIFYEGKPHFLCYPVMSKFVVRKDMIEEDIQILPLRRQMFPYEPYSLNKESLEKLNQEELIAEQLYYLVLKEYDTFLALEDKYKYLNSTQTFETYQQHKLTSTSYLFFKGEKDSGKTRALEVHYGLDYRPLLSPSLPSANIYTYLGFHEDSFGTILEDDAHKLNNDQEKLSIYRSGYRKKARCPRIAISRITGKRIQVYYKSFGCKLFAGYYMPYDESFNDRCIQILMVQGEPIKDEIEAEDWERWNSIKMQLLALRMKTYFDSLPQISTPLRGRSKEIWKPKLQVFQFLFGLCNPTNSIPDVMIELSQEAERKKIERLKTSFGAELTRVIVEACNDQKKLQLPFAVVWEGMMNKIIGTEIGQSYETDLYGRVSKRRLASQLDSSFGGERRIGGGGTKEYFFRKGVLNHLIKKFHLTDEGLKLFSSQKVLLNGNVRKNGNSSNIGNNGNSKEGEMK